MWTQSGPPFAPCLVRSFSWHSDVKRSGQDEADAGDEPKNPDFLMRIFLALSVCLEKTQHSSNDRIQSQAVIKLASRLSKRMMPEILKRAENEEAHSHVSEYPALLTWQAGAKETEEERRDPGDAAEDSGEGFSVHVR